MNKVIEQVTKNIKLRSGQLRSESLSRTRKQAEQGKDRAMLAVGNLAHTVMSC
jgi:phosphogluconate dehydratase